MINTMATTSEAGIAHSFTVLSLNSVYISVSKVLDSDIGLLFIIVRRCGIVVNGKAIHQRLNDLSK